MSITPIEMNLIGMNEEYFDDARIEDKREYISRKRRADLVSVVSKVLQDELNDSERKVLLGMMTENRVAQDIADEFHTSLSQIYRIRDKAKKRVTDIIKYVLLYRGEYEQYVLPPIELRNILTLAKTQLTDSPTIVHRLKKLMARECIGIEKLYRIPGLNKNSVNEIFCGHRLPSVQEIIVFSNFFCTSADYLLKGEITCQKH